MSASRGKWQVVAWSWPGGQSALTSRIWHSSQAAAKWRLPSSFVERERYEPFYGCRLPSNSDRRGPRTLACAPNGRRRAVLQTERARGRKEDTVQGVKESLELRRENSFGKCGTLWSKDWQE